MPVRPRLLFLNNQGLGSVGGGVTILRHLTADLVRDFDVTVLSYDPPAPGHDNVRQVSVSAPQAALWPVAPLVRAKHLVNAVPASEIGAADLVVALDCHFVLLLGHAIPRRLLYLSLSCIPRQEWFASRGIAAVLFFVQYAFLERRLAKFAAAVLVSSATHSAELRRFERLQSLKPFVIYPAFPLYESTIRSEPTGTTTILCTGRLAPGKNYQSVIELASRLIDLDCRFIIAGDGSERERLEAQTVAAGLSDRVVFTGQITDIAPLLSSADIFLHPSRYESFGISVFEAMRAGVPPVCSSTAVSGIREFLEDGVNSTLVDFGLPDQVASALRELISSRARRKSIGAAARSTAAQILTRDYVAEFRRVMSMVGIEAPTR